MSPSDAQMTSVSTLRSIADFQFGKGAGKALLHDAESLRITRTSSGRPQQIHRDGDHLLSFGTDGRFTLGLAGGNRLAELFDPPQYHVIIDSESEPFIRDGKNIFAKFVSDVDPIIRAGDEVIILSSDGQYIGVGRAELSAIHISDFNTGMAVSVRESLAE